MLKIIINFSVWISFFAGKKESSKLFALLDEDLICVNNLILAELIPFLRHRKEEKIINLLQTVKNIPLIIDWPEIITMQTICLKHGINNVGIPDLLIAQNAIKNSLKLYSLNHHFSFIAKYTSLKIFI
jgi:hypothetical protein